MALTKLCVVTHTFLPHVGGIERVAYEQSKRLMKQNYNVQVLTSRNYTPKKYSYDGINVVCYDSMNTGFRLGIPYPIPNVSSYKVFLKAVKSSQIIHAHGHPYLSSLMAAKLANQHRKPFVLTEHNTFIKYSGLWETIEAGNDIAIGRQTIKKADKIIAVSKATRNYVLKLGADPKKLQLIYNGVDTERFKPLPNARNAAREKLGIPKDAVVAATVRRLVYKNGIDTLLETAQITVKKNPQLIYLAIGEGPDYEAVKAKVSQLGLEKNFVLTGYVPAGDLAGFYNAADFSILPSKSGEGLPLAALEAMSCGLPLVATDVGGIREVMAEGGRIVPPNDPHALAEASLQLLGTDFAGLGKNLRQSMLENYSWNVNILKLAKVYQELI
jgi:glycosyltransferase involved in cell wall biosynthesis